jgi:hypothetical protein
MELSVLYVTVSASNGGHYAPIPSPFCHFLGENLTHIFANFALVTLPIGLQNWNHSFAANLSHKT